MVTRSKLLAHYGNVVWLNANKRTDASTKRKHITQALTLPPNASTNASTNGGDASRVGKRCSYYLVEFIFSSFLYPDARRVAPIRV